MFSEDSSPIVRIVLGAGMLLTGLLIAVPVAPMLFYSRDQRDLVGGIAGGIVVVILVSVGGVIAFRDMLPKVITGPVYFGLGVGAILLCVSVVALTFARVVGWWEFDWAGPRVMVISPYAICFPISIVLAGVQMIRRAFSVDSKKVTKRRRPRRPDEVSRRLD